MNKKLIGLSILLMLLIVGLSGCNETNGFLIKGTGKIKYIELEGGFYGIVSDDGENYDPVNLQSEFQIDDLRVKFILKPLENQTSIHMWGTLVEIINIEKE